MNSTSATSTDATKPHMTVRGATFLGVGSMVGAGIFALLGEAGAVAGAATWLSFLLAGLLTLLLGYTVAKLGVRYPSSGGFVVYLKEAFGSGHTLGIAAWLGYFAMVIMTAMVAVSFGGYTVGLFSDDPAAFWTKLLAAGVVLLMVAVNLRGAGVVDRAQSTIVMLVLTVFAVFVIATLANLEPALLAPSDYPPGGDILASIALTFFAFLGFSVITFAAGDLENPSRDLPRATYYAIGIATTVYVAVALGVFGTLTVQEVIDNGSTAIAVAAEPTLGQFGFTLISVAAMLATAGATNASLYGAAHLTAMLGTIRQFPRSFATPTRRGFPGGLMITALLVLVMSIFFDLTAIASLGTVVALLLFLLLSAAGIRLRRETGAHLLPMIVAILAILAVLASFLAQTLQDDPRTFVSILVLVMGAVVCDFGWKAFEQRGQGGGDAPRVQAGA